MVAIVTVTIYSYKSAAENVPKPHAVEADYRKLTQKL